MPILDESMEQLTATTGFHFSAVRVQNLGATEYTLFGLAADRSGSLQGFDADIEGCVRSVFESCQRSPRADNLMARYVTFNHALTEVHGFKQLADCHLASYAGTIRTGGGTALYDASVNVVDSMATYGKSLIAQDYMVNGIVVVLTDGIDESSTLRANAVKDALTRAMKSESLESLVSILVGINVQNPQVGDYLRRFKDETGFREYVELKDATPKTLARLAGFISKSVSSQSTSLGSKAPSQPLTF